jgi:large subunit ribosomal protein L4
MEALVYNKQAKEAGKVTLPESVFGLPWNADLVHQVVLAVQANARNSTAHTKDRSEVRGGGRKPWKQKGTGQARHGSIRSPIWKGGGIAHGPRNEKDYSQKVNKKMRVKALFTALSQKYQDGELIFVDEFSLNAPKTKEAKDLLLALASVKGFEHLATKKKNAALVAIAEKNDFIKKSFGNFGNVEVEEVRNLNVLDVLTHKFVVVVGAENAISTLEAKLSVTKDK